jgi:hypothetical protein
VAKLAMTADLDPKRLREPTVANKTRSRDVSTAAKT